MERKTSETYQREVLKKYKEDKGGAMMSGYLMNPTRSSIRDACLWLLERRKEKDDEYILNHFFKFKEEEHKARHIQGLKSEKADKFVPVINFLKGKVKKTSPENIELISWLIDFKPRPYKKYLKSGNQVSKVHDEELEIDHEPKGSDIGDLNELKEEEKKKKRWWIITTSIIVTVVMTIIILGLQKWNINTQNSISKEPECMTWGDSLYMEVSCDKGPLSEFGTQVKPLDQMKIKNMRKVKVHAGYPFFAKNGKPLIWYYKKSNKEIEYFTAPGLHPTNGETLRKITPYIIETYVPVHTTKKSSFVP